MFKEYKILLTAIFQFLGPFLLLLQNFHQNILERSCKCLERFLIRYKLRMMLPSNIQPIYIKKFTYQKSNRKRIENRTMGSLGYA